MNKKVISIAAGEYKTRICVIDYKKKRPNVYQTLVLDTPTGCVQDGFIRDRKTLAKEIRGQLKAADIRITDVVFTITSSKIATHEVLIPMVKTKEIKEYVNASASDFFPINISDYKISYMILERIKTQQSRNYRLLAIAARNDLLESYFELAKELGFDVISIDYLSNSILQLAKKQIYHRDTSMFVQINEKNTLLYILNNGILKFHRTISYGMEDTLEVVMNSIVRITEYYTSKDPDNHIQSMYLTGAGSKPNGAARLFQNELGLEVVTLSELKGNNFSITLLPQGYIQSDFLDCIGASYAPLGLVPKQYSELVEKKDNLKVVIEVGAFAVFLSFVLMIASFIKVAYAKETKDRLNASIASLQKVESIYSKNSELNNKLNYLNTIDKNCYCNTEKLGDLLTEFSEKLPKNIVLKSLDVNDTGITMDISINSQDAAAMTFIQLESISMLKDIKTDEITVEKDEYGLTTFNYTVTANYTSDDNTSVQPAE